MYLEIKKLLQIKVIFLFKVWSIVTKGLLNKREAPIARGREDTDRTNCTVNLSEKKKCRVYW